MSKHAAPAIATTKASLPIGGWNDTPAGLVCIALALALFVLAFRIASVW
jgi:nicotinamide mononucleotide (NMN) deamidase PncC